VSAKKVARFFSAARVRAMDQDLKRVHELQDVLRRANTRLVEISNTMAGDRLAFDRKKAAAPLLDDVLERFMRFNDRFMEILRTGEQPADFPQRSVVVRGLAEQAFAECWGSLMLDMTRLEIALGDE